MAASIIAAPSRAPVVFEGAHHGLHSIEGGPAAVQDFPAGLQGFGQAFTLNGAGARPALIRGAEWYYPFANDDTRRGGYANLA